jgi:uncharacterized protein YlzI (FlbEa/FlbD family)
VGRGGGVLKEKISKVKDRIIESFKEIQLLGLILGILSSTVIMIIIFWLVNIGSWLGNTDANAWIQTVGTLFGSFAGAGLSGWLALKISRDDFEKRQNAELKKARAITSSYIFIYSSSSELVIKSLQSAEKIYLIPIQLINGKFTAKEGKSEEIKATVIKNIKVNINRVEHQMKKLDKYDYSKVDEASILVFDLMVEGNDRCVMYLHEMLNFLDKNEIKSYKQSLKGLDAAIDLLKDSIEKSNTVIKVLSKS